MSLKLAIRCAEGGDLEMLKEQLENGLNVDEQDSYWTWSGLSISLPIPFPFPFPFAPILLLLLLSHPLNP